MFSFKTNSFQVNLDPSPNTFTVTYELDLLDFNTTLYDTYANVDHRYSKLKPKKSTYSIAFPDNFVSQSLMSALDDVLLEVIELKALTQGLLSFQNALDDTELFDMCHSMTTSLITKPLGFKLGEVKAKMNRTISEYEKHVARVMGEDFKLSKDGHFKVISEGVSAGNRMSKELEALNKSFKRHYKT